MLTTDFNDIFSPEAAKEQVITVNIHICKTATAAYVKTTRKHHFWILFVMIILNSFIRSLPPPSNYGLLDFN